MNPARFLARAGTGWVAAMLAVGAMAAVPPPSQGLEVPLAALLWPDLSGLAASDDDRDVHDRVQTFLARGNVEGALGALDEAVAAHPDDPAPRALRGLLRGGLGQTAAARPDLEILLSMPLAASADEASALRGVALVLLKRPREALPELDRAQGVLGRDPALMSWLRGRAYFDLGDFAQARKHLDSALADMPDDVPTLKLHARALVQLHLFPQAKADCVHALEIAPEDVEAWTWLALVGAGLQDEPDAREALRHVKALAPGAPLSRFAAAGVLQVLGKPGEALAEVDAARRPSPEWLRAQLDLLRVKILLDLSRPAEALADADPVVARAATAETLTLRARAHLDFADGRSTTPGRDRQAALDDLDRALALAPEDPDALYQRGRARLLSGRFAGSVADFEQARRLDASLNAGLLVEALEAEGRFEQARPLADEKADESTLRAVLRYLAHARGPGSDPDDAGARLAAVRPASDTPYLAAVRSVMSGRDEPEVLRAAVAARSAKPGSFLSCYADFVIAQRFLIEGRVDAARPLLESQVESCHNLGAFDARAAAELGRLGSPPQASANP